MGLISEAYKIVVSLMKYKTLQTNLFLNEKCSDKKRNLLNNPLVFYSLTLSQTSPGFYVSQNVTLENAFPTVFSTRLESFLPLSSNLQL